MLGFFEAFDGFVNFVNGLGEIFGGKFGIARERILELVEAVLKIGDINILVLDGGELGLVGEGIFGGVGDDADER